ncbi:MAG: nitrite reductase large subunit NirB [Cytophagaceae bacterium]|nr:nitrite reductase large subunit NirB [Cytophagaceae bacterium]MDW8455277.1 nitrite reductase large subunit NirB [Cytophagaceae bacterium]
MKKIIVAGNGMVGYKFCEKLISKSGTDKFQITVLGEEPRPAYDRVHLSEYFSGKTANDLLMAKEDWYKQNQINLLTNHTVTNIDRFKKTVHTHNGKKYNYDYLILATGSAPFVPNIQGTDKEGVFVYRTIEDLEMIKAWGKKAKTGSVIGGGLLGLEAAKALLDMGLQKVYVIEFAQRLMPRQLDEKASAILQKQLEKLGLTILLNKNTRTITGNQAINGLTFSDESSIESDILIISAGIKARDELADKCGLEKGPRGGFKVNHLLQTSDPSIYAIGECASYEGMIYGLVAPGYDMAEVVAHNLCQPEQTKTFNGCDLSTKLKLIGTDVASIGNPFIEEPDAKTIVYEDKHKLIYQRLNITADGKYLLGAILVGDTEQYGMMLQTYLNKIVLPQNPENLLFANKATESSDNKNYLLNLPDEALICSCESVNKGAICRAIDEHQIQDVNTIKKCTKAGTGCGGCTPMLKDLLAATLKAKGVYLRNILCEHFNYTRQELFDLIRINRLHTYDDILNRFGRGHGCEVCKPAIASILASLYNDNILKQDTIQDTNDRFLANLQKGGTYSVVPRIPGGEITPDKLIVIGQVAKKYGLYTKITGGQRIDMFGAHLNDLPAIWEELINAGFESGHAYGKALRTVKSCVGSTWCRFGLHDSVSFAIEIENRYKGLRAPHKIKAAVSGCVRECAEAQSKDFGIIATEKGWNLYVCGNGGAKPQHAVLLASDIDKETCIKYIDRFLMFYIRTADPLTRTATWFNKLEGGIEYLRDVIINDSLGIAEELEKEMQILISNYKCEWKEAVETPEIRNKFRYFVNTDEKDPTVQFEPMRDQIKAKEW